jgi:hypothetical protein
MEFIPLDNQTSYYKELQKPHHQTAIVTFAGKNNPEYIDGAVMLGISAQKYLPEYVRAAMIIEGMPQIGRSLLKKGGWKLITVPNWDSEYCGEGCDLEFLGRWHDSFEKINAFRLPFKRVLFLDADTYIFKDRIRWLAELQLPTIEHIAMAKDGCKDEYNSGVMFFKPDVDVFRSMLKMVAQRRREQILDQNLINDYYRGMIVEVDRKFNCVDTVGIQPGQTEPCDQHCTKGAVVAHFTGHPKPTAAKRRLLELVRRPNAPALACVNTNFGSCGKWSELYCDIRTHSARLSPELRAQLKNTGTCCHPHMMTKREKKKMSLKNVGFETCQECPATMRLSAPNPNLSALAGSYVKTTLQSPKFNGGRPIYLNLDSDVKNAPVYMFFMQEKLAWAIGGDYSQNVVFGYAGMEAQCPRDTRFWAFFNSETQAFDRKHFDIRGEANGYNAPNDTDHIAWNMDTFRWEHDKIVWENSRLEHATAIEEEEGMKFGENDTIATREEEGGEADDKNATENEGSGEAE